MVGSSGQSVPLTMEPGGEEPERRGLPFSIKTTPRKARASPTKTYPFGGALPNTEIDSPYVKPIGQHRTCHANSERYLAYSYNPTSPVKRPKAVTQLI